jgi:hypothetical protein
MSHLGLEHTNSQTCHDHQLGSPVPTCRICEAGRMGKLEIAQELLVYRSSFEAYILRLQITDFMLTGTGSEDLRSVIMKRSAF